MLGSISTHRVVGWWNELPGNVVTCSSLDGFKRGVDQFLDGKGME